MEKELNAEHKQNKLTLKSTKSKVMSFLRFVNKTKRRVDVIWINYEGQAVKYKTLDCDECLDVNTFVGHPWIFRDSETGDKLVVQLKHIYNPPAWHTSLSKSENKPVRRIVVISIPSKYV